MKKIIFGLVAASCLAGANGVIKNNNADKKVDRLEPQVKRAYGDAPEQNNFVTYVNNYFYFDRLIHRIPKLNTSKKNGLVIIQQLLGYYDTFYDDQVVAESYEWKVDDFISDPNHPTCEQFRDSPTTSTAYYNHLVDVYRGLGYTYNENNGTTHDQDKKMLRKIWKEYNASIVDNNLYINPCDNNWFDKVTDASQFIVYKEIGENHNPVIVRKDNQVGIAYAYNSNYVWLYMFDQNDGYWNGMVKKPISFIDNAYVLAVQTKTCVYTTRSHSDNYAFYTTAAKKWLSGYNNHVMTTPNFNGYHDWYTVSY